jgi:hypothetical protein
MRQRLAVAGALAIAVIGLAGCANGSTAGDAAKSVGTSTSSTAVSQATTTTTAPCPLSSQQGAAVTVPISEVCSATGAPHFATPNAAMAYLSTAWNAGNVQEIDYVTDPAGRAQMDSMAAQMVNLQFKSCTANPAGDYTCFFNHDITPSDSSTTYPDPGDYPPGEAVFTVAPASTPGWYLTEVIHCG